MQNSRLPKTQRMAHVIQIAHLGLHDQVVSRLRTMLVEGRIAPGAKLNERELSEMLQVSRTPLREAIKPDGAVWVVWPKGQKAFREDDARQAGPAAGLVDVKVASFSETLSALKMVIPVKDRIRMR